MASIIGKYSSFDQEPFMHIVLESVDLNTRTGSTYCPNYLLYQPTIDLDLSQVVTDFTTDDSKPDQFTIDLSGLNDSITSASSAINTRIWSLKTRAEATLVHDFTFGNWCSATDVKLTNIFPNFSLNTNVTPDFGKYIEDHNLSVVVEFGTSQTTDENRGRSLAIIKINRYKDLIEPVIIGSIERAYFFSVVVTNNCVHSNIVLTDEICTDLIIRYRIGRLMYTEGIKAGVFKALRDKDKSAEYSEIQQIITGLPSVYMSDTRPDMITKDDYEKFTTMIPLRSVRQYNKNSIKAIKKIMDYRPCVNIDVSSDFLAKCTQGDRRIHSKKVSPITPFICSINHGEKIPSFFISGFEENDINRSYANLWNSAHQTIKKPSEENKNNILVEALKDPILSGSDIIKEKLSYDYKICVPKLNQEDIRTFAEVGVEAKLRKLIQEVPRLDKKKSLSFDLDVTDIDCDLDSDWLQEKYMFNFNSKEIFETLIDKAEKIHTSTIPLHEIYEQLNNTNGFVSSLIISAIGAELAINFRTHTKLGEYIIRKVRGWDCYLLIKTTKSDSHCFYSILIPKPTSRISNWKSSVQFLELGNYYVLPFRSVNQSKVNNMVRMASLFIGNWALQEYRKDISEIVSSVKQDRFKTRYLNLCHMIALENKRCTEQSITQYRYIVMNLLSTYKDNTRIRLLVNKMNPLFRSRLELFIVKEQLHAINVMMHKKPRVMNIQELENDDATNDYISDYYDYVCRDYNSSFSSIIETFYMGYFTDKNQSFSENLDGKMIEKILEEELKIVDARPNYQGQEEPLLEDIRTHEYSPSYVHVMANDFKEHMERQNGSGWEALITSEIYQDLSYISYEKLATLKSSSNFDPEIHKKLTSAKPRVPRQKMIEKIINVVKETETHTPISVLEKCLKTCEEKKGISVDLFPKPQFNGMREILILNENARIIQAFIEMISRVLCKQISHETITHKNESNRVPLKHYKGAKTLGFEPLTMLSADDKTRWNQKIKVKAMFQFLIQVLPKQFHAFLCRVCNIWCNKFILLPPGVIKQLEKNIPVNNNIRIMLTDLYNGDQISHVMEKGNTFITVYSGMMQGQLHLLSSLFHSAYLLSMKIRMPNLIARTNKQFTNYNVLIDYLVSSDDSSSLISVAGANKLVAMMYAHVLSEIPTETACLVGFNDSIKSARHLDNIMEFNSQFMICGQIIQPVTKLIVSCTTLPISSSLLGRQELMSSLLTSVLETSGSIALTRICQVSQGLIHYICEGLLNNSIFEEYASSLLSIPDPGMGFFLMDHPIASGLLGMTYNNYIMIKNDPYVNRRVKEQTLGKFLDCTPHGNIAYTGTIFYGNDEKFFKFRDKCVKNLDIEQMITEEPELILRKSDTKEKVLCKLGLKIGSPGVRESLGTRHDALVFVASSVYLLNKLCVQFKTPFMSKEESFNLKQSLYSLSKRIPPDDFLTPEELKWVCPNYEHHDKMEKIINNINEKSLLMKVPVYRKNVTKIIIERSWYEDEIALIDLCCYFWVDKPLPYYKPSLEEQWRKAKVILPWLRDNFKDTIVDSPFDSAMQVIAYLSKFQQKNRTVTVLSAPLKTRGREINITRFVRLSQWPRKRFFLTGKDTEEHNLIVQPSTFYERQRELGYQYTRQFLHMSLPRQEPILRAFDRFSTNSIDIKMEDIHFVKNKWVKHSLLLEANRMINRAQPFTGEFINKIGKVKGLVLGYYTKIQKREKKKYIGVGSWNGSLDGINIKISYDNGKLLSITTENAVLLSTRVALFNQLLHEIGITSTSHKKHRVGTWTYNDKKIYTSKEERLGGVMIREGKVEFDEKDLLNNAKFKIDYREKLNNIRLLKEDSSKPGVWNTVLSLSYTYNDCIQHNYTTKHDKRFEDFWIFWDKPTILDIHELLTKCMDDYKEHEICTNHGYELPDSNIFKYRYKLSLKSFFKNLIESRLFKCGISFKAISGLKVPTIREVRPKLNTHNLTEVFNEIAQLSLTMTAEIAPIIEEMYDVGEDFELPTIIPDYVDTDDYDDSDLESSVLSSNVLADMKYLLRDHALLDDFISDELWWKTVYEKKVPSAYSEIAHVVAWFLGYELTSDNLQAISFDDYQP